jgi:hypothetical protein
MLSSGIAARLSEGSIPSLSTSRVTSLTEARPDIIIARLFSIKRPAGTALPPSPHGLYITIVQTKTQIDFERFLKTPAQKLKTRGIVNGFSQCFPRVKIIHKFIAGVARPQKIPTAK